MTIAEARAAGDKPAAGTEPFAGEEIAAIGDAAVIASLDALLNADNFDLLLETVDALLLRRPHDRRLTLRRACALLGCGRASEAKAAFDSALAQDPAIAKCHLMVAAALARLGAVSGAAAQLKEAVHLDPASASAWKALGFLQQKMKDHHGARHSLERASALAPMAADAQMLLALTLDAVGETEACRAACLRAIAFAEAEPSIVYRSARMLARNGATREARSSLEALLGDRPDHVSARWSLATLRLQMMEARDEEVGFWRDLEARSGGGGGSDFALLTAIAWFALGRFEEARRLVEGAAVRSIPERAAALRESQPKRARFLESYQRFLSALVSAPAPLGEEAAGAPIAHFGDSHCLSFAHRSVSLDGAARRVEPRLCLGAKAHHLAADRPNEAKALLALQAEAVLRQDPAALFISFGEIDCRQDEGIVAHHQKTGEPLEEIASRTADRYAQSLAEIFAERRCEAYVFGVPAPICAPEVSADAHALRREAIRRFNGALAWGAEARGLRFVDLHALTVDADGVADDRLYCDGVHLGPAALPAIEARLGGIAASSALEAF